MSKNYCVLVIGGSGFSGQQICKEAIDSGFNVKSFNRSGCDKVTSQYLKEKVEWIKGDASDESQLKQAMEGCHAKVVISTLGLISFDNDKMAKVNGEMNVKIMESAKNCGVDKFVYISEASVPLNPKVTPVKGYYEGKKYAEEQLQTLFPENGYILRPGIMHGWRKIGKNISVPLHFIFAPIEKLSFFAGGFSPVVPKFVKRSFAATEFSSIVSVEAMAKAAIACVKRDGVKKILEADDIRAFGCI